MALAQQHSRLARPAAPFKQALAPSPRILRANRLLARATTAAADVGEDSWDADVLKYDAPVLVDFWAPWCGPCKMIAPMVDEIAREYDGKAKAVKVNTDASPNIASKYGVRSIPTVMIFKGGDRVETIIGAVPKTTLTNALDKYL